MRLVTTRAAKNINFRNARVAWRWRHGMYYVRSTVRMGVAWVVDSMHAVLCSSLAGHTLVKVVGCDTSAAARWTSTSVSAADLQYGK